jgi:aminoglycoside phosphotransferase (APT) family kinase protein
MTTEKVHINEELVRHLIASQFPQWGDLPIKPVEFDGHDNTTYRLGENMSVRLPTHKVYARQVEKEHRWLPKLAPNLPLPIPTPIAKGAPTDDFALPWSIYRWLKGKDAEREPFADINQAATALGEFLSALQRNETSGWPSPGYEQLFRGAPPEIFAAETRDTITMLKVTIDTEAATAVLEAALAAPAWHGPPVWFHGDLSAGNLLVENGQLSAVIDFGSAAVGDPACDLMFAWKIFSGESLRAFRAALPFDNATWARGRGWAIWKGLITLAEHIDTNSVEAEKARHFCEAVIADFKMNS